MSGPQTGPVRLSEPGSMQSALHGSIVCSVPTSEAVCAARGAQ